MRTRLATSIAALTAAATLGTGTAHADGFYYGQSYGVSSARGDGNPRLGASLQLRVQLGWQWGHLSVGPWFGGHLAGERDGAFYGVVGGDPVMGDSDFESVGADVRYSALIKGPFSAYVRGGPRFGWGGKGALDGYEGFGIGAATGVQLTGRVRALGFLFAPLFLSKRGPKINACLYLDQNVDYYRVSAGAGMPTLSMPIVGTSIGIGAGSYF